MSGSVIRDTFKIGTQSPIATFPNQTGADWLTVWNTASGPIGIASPAQAVGALRARSFYVPDDDPISAFWLWGPKVSGIVTQPGASDRVIAYALGDAPIFQQEEPLYGTAFPLVAGSTPGNSTTTITPGSGECFTAIDLAVRNAQAAGAQQEALTARYGLGLDATLLYPPTGTSRQIVDLFGPVKVTLVSGSLAAAMDWTVWGVSNVVR